MKHIAAFFLICIFTAIAVAHASSSATLTVTAGKQKKTFTTQQLIDHPQARDITVPNDVSYKKTMRYRAVPSRAVLEGIDIPADMVVEAVASDGFAAQLPRAVLDDGKAQAFLAVEPYDKKWPNLSGKDVSAGPFYVVWLNPAAANIRSEQWPYMVMALRLADAPEKRWKEIAVDAALPASSPIRAGQALFVTQCMSCHTMNGAGSAKVGPDLNRPANPTAYFTRDALKKFIRNPASLRTWEGMQMSGFDASDLSDAEIELIVQYLEHMNGRQVK